MSVTWHDSWLGLTGWQMTIDDGGPRAIATYPAVCNQTTAYRERNNLLINLRGKPSEHGVREESTQAFVTDAQTV